MVILAMIMGLIVGFGLAYMVVGMLVEKSNNSGDSKASFFHFTKAPLEVLIKEDKVKKDFYL